MPSVDNRVVRLEFDNAAFERKVDATLHSLGQLNEALKLEGAAKGFAGIQDAAKGINLSSIAEGVDHIASRFSALGAIAFSVIQSMTQGALGFAKKIGGDILEPIIGGGRKRALNLEQARFLFEGIGMDVEKAMGSARKAVLGTAFGLDEAAKAGAQFGASGVDAGEEMYHTLRGVAGVAAMTNSQFSEISDVFTQAAGQGKITGYTLERIAMRGLNVAAALGKQMGKSEADIRNMASEGKISFKEFAAAMDDAFGAHAQEANKTFTGALENMQAALARVGAEVFTPQLKNQRDLFNALTPAIDKVHEALMPLLNAFNFLTTLSMAKFVKGIKGIDFTNLTKAMPIITKGFVNIWVALDRIKHIGLKAFQQIFPPSTTSALIKFSNAFLEFTKHLTISGKAAQQIGRIFKGFFSIISIGWTIIKEGIKFFLGLARSMTSLSGSGVLEFFAKIGDFFTNLQQALVKGKGIHQFFVELGDAIQAPIQYLKDFKDAFLKVFGGIDPKITDKVGASMGRVSDRFEHLKGLLEKARDIWRPFGDALSKVTDALDTAWQAIERWFKELGRRMASVMKKGDFSALFDAINVTLLGGIAALIAKWMHGGINVDLTGGVMSSLTRSFDQLTGVLKSMQMKIKAEAIMKIAEALALLTASVLVLSMIDSAALTKALTAMAVGFGQLMAAFAVLNKMDANIKSGATFDMVAGGMIAMATAMVIMGGALTILARISWGDLVKGLVATTALIAIMIVSSKGLSKAAPGLILGGVGMIAMGTGLTILAGAVALFGQMNWKTLGMGLLGIAGSLVVIALAMNMMPANIILTGAGLILVATALNILAGAMKMFGMLKWGEIGKGMVVLAGALIIIGVAMNLMPAYLPLIGAGLVLVAIALNGLAAALKVMGGMSWGEIAKSLVVLAGALIILAVGVTAMTDAIPGALALVIISFGLGMLAEVLKSFADLSWGDLLHGLLGVAIALAALALAALLLEPAVGAMAAMGAALVLVGAGFALLGLGAMLFATGLETLAKSGAAGAKAIVSIMGSIGAAIPELVNKFAEGLVDLIMTIGKALPVIVKLLGQFLLYLVEELIKLIPKLAEAIGLLIENIVKLVYEHGPELIQLGLFMLNQLLTGLEENMGEIVTHVANIIINFINALSEKVPELVDSVYNFILTVIEAVLVKLQQLPMDMFAVVGRAIMAGMYGGILRKAAEIAKWFAGLGLAVIRWIGNVARTLWQKGTDFISGLLGGIGQKAMAVISWFGGLAGNVIRWIGNVARTLWQKGVDFIGGILGGIHQKWNDVASWVSGIGGRVKTAIGNLFGTLQGVGGDLIGGLLQGVKDGWSKLTGWISDAASHLPGPVKKLFGIGSPSRVFMEIGGQLMDGFYIGVKDGWGQTASYLENIDIADHMDTNAIADSFKSIMENAFGAVNDMTDLSPVITPVLDLTQVAADASKIGSYISTTPVATLALAGNIAADTNAAKSPDSTTATDVATGGVKFEQNIYAPEQLSTADIYKQTRNQITMAKEELRIP